MDLDSAVFYTNDLKKIKRFYLEIIGLKFDYQDGDKYISFIFPNGSRLGINKSAKSRERPGVQTVFLSVTDIEKEYQRFQKLGFSFYEPLKEFSWGKYFAILDPDNNKVGFIQNHQQI